MPFAASPTVSRLTLLGVFAALLAFGLAELPFEGQVLLSSAMVGIGYWVSTRAPELRHALLFLSVAVSLRYLWWRGHHSLDLVRPADLLIAWSLYGAELYGFVIMVLGYLQTTVLEPRRPTPLPADPARWPTVDVFVPTYDEPVDIVRRTLLGALGMDYPHVQVHLLDDGRRPAMRELAQELGVTYHVRGDNKHAKAGNINAALARTQGELVAIFDCDHVPVRSFLGVTVGAFVADPGLALMQTPHYFYNPDPFERNLGLDGRMPSENAIFYHAVQIGNDFWNSVLFCGSCAVLRRSALEEVGGIAVETVTEDAHTSLRMAARGWRSAYLDVPQAAGLATERYAFHVAQRVRWARGMTQILRLDNPLWMPGLSWPQRLAYLNAALHFQFGLPRLIFFLAPISYLLFDLRPVQAHPLVMLAYVVPHMMLAIMGGDSGSRGMRQAFWAEVYEAALAPYTALVTALAWVAPRQGKFNVTVKGARLDAIHFDWRSAAPNLVLLALCLAALAATPLRVEERPSEALALVSTALFNLYNCVVLLAAVAVAIERPQQRRSHRVARTYPVYLLDPMGHEVLASGESRDLAEEGMGVLCAGLPELPDQVLVVLDLGADEVEAIPKEIRSRSAADGSLWIGLEVMGPLSLVQRRDLVKAMFSPPDSWQVRGQFVPAARALAGVAQAPWRAFSSLFLGRRAA
jgi:cellulose synthase (UDP-forming)